MTPSELLARDMARAEKYAEFGRALFEEDAMRSIVEADGSCEVYFFQESGMGAIKIGITGNLWRRLQTMRTNTPHEVEVLGSVHADERLEKYLKRRFAHAHIRGEWFRPIDELVAYIQETTGFQTPKRTPAKAP